ncbi:MAG: lipopolysaccharide heptosyltransferase II [Gemmatimonadales bacterium]|nr:lipopolysaccharide heptosyltransferase II [Gemmatimonadales bacterium]
MSLGLDHLAPDILAVRFSAIGDILLTTPLLRALRTRHPGARIAVLTKERYVPLLSDNPNVNEVFGMDPDQALREVAKLIRSVEYTHLLDLHGNLRTLALRRLAPGPWSSFSKNRLARAALILTKRNLYPDTRPMAERYFEAAAGLDVEPDGSPPEFFLSPQAGERAAARLSHLGIGNGSALVAIAPGAAHATKRWPPLYWLELARRLRETGADIVVLGGPDDVALAEWIASSAAPGSVSLAGMLALQETGAVIERSAALVSGDTGVMHMATGVGTPVVAIFGPTVREFGFFPYRSERSAVVERALGCRPCSSQGGARCPLGHHHCMRQTAPDAVYAALHSVLA